MSQVVSVTVAIAFAFLLLREIRRGTQAGSEPVYVSPLRRIVIAFYGAGIVVAIPKLEALTRQLLAWCATDGAKLVDELAKDTWAALAKALG